VSAAATTRANVTGAALLAAAMTLFNAGDTFVKLLSERLPLPEVIATRNLLAAGLVLLAWSARPGLIRRAHLTDRGVLARAALDTCTTLLYLLGVSLLPLAEAATLLFVSPLLGTALAGLVLRERVGRLRWLAVAAGFAGVLLVAQPGGVDWRPAALLPLVAACFMAVADIVTRRIDPAVGPVSVVLTNLMAVAIAAGLWAALDPQPVAAADLPRSCWRPASSSPATSPTSPPSAGRGLVRRPVQVRGTAGRGAAGLAGVGRRAERAGGGRDGADRGVGADGAGGGAAGRLHGGGRAWHGGAAMMGAS
jgi:drug/metabolite transporter (DMT)-like permease